MQGDGGRRDVRGIVTLAIALLATLSFAYPATAAVDIVGGLSNSSGPNPFNAKGNAFQLEHVSGETLNARRLEAAGARGSL